MPAHKTQLRDISAWAQRLACPVCYQPLRVEETRVDCLGCGRLYPVVDGIPVLIAERATEPESAAPKSAGEDAL